MLQRHDGVSEGQHRYTQLPSSLGSTGTAARTWHQQQHQAPGDSPLRVDSEARLFLARNNLEFGQFLDYSLGIWWLRVRLN